MKNFLLFNNKDCEKYLNISAENLVYKLDNDPQFDELTCDLTAKGYVISTESEDLYINLLQFIADTYKTLNVKAFFQACGIDSFYIDQIDFLDSSAKVLSSDESKKLNKSIDDWQEELSDFLMSKFNWIEYCAPQRESSFDDITISNYIKFPKAENGKVLTDTKLLEIIDIMYNPEDPFMYRFLGQLDAAPKIIDMPDAKYIVWNQISMDEYDRLPGYMINKLYRY